jgi:DNA processing protein
VTCKSFNHLSKTEDFAIWLIVIPGIIEEKFSYHSYSNSKDSQSTVSLLYSPIPRQTSPVAIPKHWHPDIPYIRALMECPGFGGATLERLVGLTGSIQALWKVSEEFLKQHLAEIKRIAFLRRRDEGLSEQWLDTWQTRCEQWQAIPIGFTDVAYPPLLREIAQFPPLLYLRGSQTALLCERQLAIVGTRKMSEYGRKATGDLIRDLLPASSGVVSGLAAGIDTEAHTAALLHGLPTIAVFGCGLDIVYPVANRSLAAAILSEGGALISECEFGVAPTRHSFPRRNRIVAGLCQGTVVIEGDLRSGAMITARFALEEGRTVFALPGRVTDVNAQGPLKLLQDGATPLIKASDILLELGWNPVMTKRNEDAMISSDSVLSTSFTKAQEQVEASLNPVIGSKVALALEANLSSEDQEILACLDELPITLEELSQKLSWPMAQINQRLSLLELEGCVSLLSGSRVIRCSC